MTEDEDLKRIEDKLVEALPGLAGEEKPPEYADAPQWQKDAWDSETNKALREMAEKLDVPQEIMEIQELGTSHWSTFLPAPPPCGGWAMPSEFIAPLPPSELPRVSVRRGGIKFPRISFEHGMVITGRWWWKRYYLHMRIGGQPMRLGPFRFVAEVNVIRHNFETTVKMFNKIWEEEK